MILKAMRNLVYRVGLKMSGLPSPGHGHLFLCSNGHTSKHIYVLGFGHTGNPDAFKDVNVGHPWFHHVSRSSIWSRNWTQSGST